MSIYGNTIGVNVSIAYICVIDDIVWLNTIE